MQSVEREHVVQLGIWPRQLGIDIGSSRGLCVLVPFQAIAAATCSCSVPGGLYMCMDMCVYRRNTWILRNRKEKGVVEKQMLVRESEVKKEVCVR